MNRIEIVFGNGKNKDGVTIPTHIFQPAMQYIQLRAAQLFGGFTLTSAKGGWVQGEHYTSETSTMLVIYYDKDDDLDPMVQELVHTIKETLDQDTVLAFKSKVQPI